VGGAVRRLEYRNCCAVKPIQATQPQIFLHNLVEVICTCQGALFKRVESSKVLYLCTYASTTKGVSTAENRPA
jgi:hypothetical protein